MKRHRDHQGSEEPGELLRSFRWTQRLAQSLVRDPGLAADLHQETWARAIERFGDAIPARQWLAGTIRSMAFRARRGRQRRRVHEALAATPDSDSGAEEVILRAEAQAEVASAVRNLPKDLQVAVLLHFQEGLSMAAIAKRVGCSKSTAGDRVQRGLLALRSELRAEGKGWRACVLLASPLGAVPIPQAADAAASLQAASVTAAGALGATTLTGIAMKKLLLVGALVALGLVAATTWKLAQPSVDPPSPSEISAVHELEPIEDRGTPETEVAATGGTARTGKSTRVAAPLPVDLQSVFSFKARVVDQDGAAVVKPRMLVKAGDWRREAEGAEDGALELSLSHADLEEIEGKSLTVFVSGSPYQTLWATYISADGTRQLAPPSAGRVEDLGTLTLEPAGAVEGQAFSDTRQPIVGAMIELLDDDAEPESRLVYGGVDPKAVTGEGGRFLVGHLLPGSLRLAVDHPDFLADCPMTTVRVVAGVTTGPVILSASKARLVTGQVLDRKGRPIEGAYVNGTQNWSLKETYETAADGRFRIALRRGSPATVQAYLNGWRQVTPAWDAVHGAGEVNIVMEPELPEAEFTVRVVDAKTEEPLYRVSVAVLNGLANGAAREVTPTAIDQPADGFSLDYIPGVDTLQISAEGYETALVSTADSAEEAPHLTVKLGRTPGVFGRLLENGQPVSGARLQLVDLQQQVASPRETSRGGRTIRLETLLPARLPGARTGGFLMGPVLGLEGDPPPHRLVVRAARHGTETDDDGRFQFPDVREAYAGLVLQRSGEPRRTIRRFSIENGTLDLGNIELQPTASVAGRIQFHMPWDPTSVAVILDDPSRTIPIADDGSFLIEDLEPGPLHLSLNNAGLGDLPGGLMPFEDPPTFYVELSAGENRQLVLNLDPWAPSSLDLEVTIGGLPPAGNSRLEVTPIDDPGRPFRLTSTVEGHHITATSRALGLCNVAIIRSSSREPWIRMPLPGPPFDLAAGATVRRTINIPAGRLKIAFGPLHPCQRFASLDLYLEGPGSTLDVVGLVLAAAATGPEEEAVSDRQALRTALLPAGTYRATLHPSKRLSGEDPNEVLAEFEVSVEPNETVEIYLDR